MCVCVCICVCQNDSENETSSDEGDKEDKEEEQDQATLFNTPVEDSVDAINQTVDGEEVENDATGEVELQPRSAASPVDFPASQADTEAGPSQLDKKSRAARKRGGRQKGKGALDKESVCCCHIGTVRLHYIGQGPSCP